MVGGGCVRALVTLMVMTGAVAYAQAEGEHVKLDAWFAVTERTARLHTRLGRQHVDDIFLRSGTGLRVRGKTADGNWVFCESRRGNVGWMPKQNIRRIEGAFAEGADSLMADGFGSSRGRVVDDRDRVGTQIQFVRDVVAFRRPGDVDHPVARFGDGQRAQVAAVHSPARNAWLLVIRDDGRWGWTPESMTRSPALKENVIGAVEKSVEVAKPTSPYSAKMTTGVAMTFSIAAKDAPSYRAYIGVSGSRTIGIATLGLSGSVSGSRSQMTEETTMQPVPLFSYGGDFSGSLGLKLSSLFSTNFSLGYSMNVDASVQDTPTLEASSNGAYGSGSVSASFTSWLSASAGGTVTLTQALEDARYYSTSERASLTLTPFSRLSMTASMRLAQSKGSTAQSLSASATYKFIDNLSGGFSFRQSREGGETIKSGSIFIDLTL
jgi:hypothetical protein